MTVWPGAEGGGGEGGGEGGGGEGEGGGGDGNGGEYGGAGDTKILIFCFDELQCGVQMT